jgi:hypothetical protein
MTPDRRERSLATARDRTSAKRRGSPLRTNWNSPCRCSISANGALATARLWFRDTQQATPIFTGESLINALTGKVNLLKSTRYSRARRRIPAGAA